MSSGLVLPQGRREVLALYEAYGRTSTSYLSLSRGLEHIRCGNDGFVAFRENLGVRVVPGNPIAIHEGLNIVSESSPDDFGQYVKDLISFITSICCILY